MSEAKISASDSSVAGVGKNEISPEQMDVHGVFTAVLTNAAGEVLWTEEFPNVVTTVGKNDLLDKYIQGSAFTQVGPFMGLISSVGYAAGALAADTMASHTGWAEAGNGANFPLWSTPASNARASVSWGAAAAGAKASTGVVFTFATTGGTVKGCFLVLGTGAVATNASTAGILFSAGVFTGGDKVVAPSDTLTITYTLSA
jgi:hypothetical protein